MKYARVRSLERCSEVIKSGLFLFFRICKRKIINIPDNQIVFNSQCLWERSSGRAPPCGVRRTETGLCVSKVERNRPRRRELLSIREEVGESDERMNLILERGRGL